MNKTNTVYAKKIEDVMSQKSAWDATQVFLNHCFISTFGLGTDNFPDTPEVDELRHEINDAVETQDLDTVLKSISSVKDQLSEDMETYLW
jgi:hypothetical protein